MIAADIAKALHGRRVGARWMAPCPAHKDKNPSLSIRDADGLILVHCFSGCRQADVIQALRGRGLWPERERREFSREEIRDYVRRRATAERQAGELSGWRAWGLRTLRLWRNTYWDAARRAQAWLEQPAGLAADWEHPLLLTALRAVSGQRLGDRLNETLEEILSASPAEILELRDRMATPAQRRAA